MTSFHWYERAWDRVGDAIVRVVLVVLAPLQWGLVWWLGKRFTPGSVLHISDPVHTAQQTVELLRAAGCKAAYLAIGSQRTSRFGDYRFRRWRVPGLRVLHEAAWFWGVARRYHVIHAHFMLGVTRSGWEWVWWKRLGRKLVVHYRGCEVRDRARNMALHPQSNICQDCDYRGRVCSHPAMIRLLPHPFVLAPMEEHTSLPFRLRARAHGAGLVFAERLDAEDVAARGDRKSVV